MHLFAENLAVEISSYYRNLALGHGVIPKVFTLVNVEGDQYLFFIDDLPFEKDEEKNQFLAYIVQAHLAVCYARGTLVIVEKNQQFIEFAVIDRDDVDSIVCSAELTRDMEDRPIGLGEFDKTLVKKSSIIFGGLFEPVQLSEDKIEDFESLWAEMKSKILHRSMGL